MARKNMKIATFIALLHLLGGHNALNLTATTVSVGSSHLTTVLANPWAIEIQLVCASLDFFAVCPSSSV